MPHVERPAQNSLESRRAANLPRVMRRLAWPTASAIALCTALVTILAPSGTARAEIVALDGAWSGGGTVSFSRGSKETARCRARFSRRSKSAYSVIATCATASGRADQTAIIQSVGENAYEGSFRNTEYDFSGSISVVVRGNTLSARLNGSGGSANLRFTR